LPATSIDTFFACTIILAAALISTAFMATTMQERIENTAAINKLSYLNAISDKIISTPGSPTNWGNSNFTPRDFGLSTEIRTNNNEIDPNKINKLSSNAISYYELEESTHLYDLALGIQIKQILTIEINQISNNTINNVTNYLFTVRTTINSRPISAILHAYPIANNEVPQSTNITSETGLCTLTTQIPETEISNAIIVIFARATFDERITSFTVYNFNQSNQEFTPNGNIITINSPIDNQINWVSNTTSITIQKGKVYSFDYTKNITILQGTNQYTIPKIIEPSPKIIVLQGNINGTFFQEWTSDPAIFSIGSDFKSTEKNLFPYIVLIGKNLYKIEISFGDIPT
jgi:hypothetical protein